MARPKVKGRDLSLRKKSNGIIINKVAPVSKERQPNFLKGEKCKGKDKEPSPTTLEESSDSDAIYATHLTTSESGS